jgi:DNA repair protein RecO (recombination protein O)
MTYHAQGIVLRREDRRDVDRTYVIYTREAGKVLAVGRGTRKILSKLAAHLEPYSAAELFLARGRRYETVCNAVLARSPEPIAADEARHAAAACFAEAFDQLVKWGEPDEELWDLANAFFGELSGAERAGVPGLLAGALWSFMAALGYRPRLDACLSCGKDPSAAGAQFLPLRGRVACRDCHFDERDLVGAEPLDTAALDDLRRGPSPILRSDLSPGAVRAAHALLEAHLDRPLISASALDFRMTPA